MQTLLRNVDQEILIIALKGTEDELKEKIFNCMSQRAAANIKDEMEVLGPVRLTEVQEAQKAVINVARTMSDEGTIVLAGRGGDDSYDANSRESKKNDDTKKNSGALKTEEILSLLSKTSQDFKKESEITENVSYLFTKKSIKDLALSNLKKDKEIKKTENTDKEVQTKEKQKEEEENKEIIEEKKITETEAKNMANALAKEYYNKGYNLGVKK